MSQSQEEVILYDVAGKEGKPVSGSALRARLVFNYKNIPYTTRFIDYPDIVSTLSALSIPPTSENPFSTHTLPAAHINGTWIMDSYSIALAAESRYPTPSLNSTDPIVARVDEAMTKLYAAVTPLFLPQYIKTLKPRDAEYITRTREPLLGDMVALEKANKWFDWEVLDPLLGEFVAMLGEREGVFFGGSSVGYADLILVSTLEAMKRVGNDCFEGFVGRDGTGRVRAVYEGCQKLGMLEKMD